VGGVLVLNTPPAALELADVAVPIHVDARQCDAAARRVVRAVHVPARYHLVQTLLAGGSFRRRKKHSNRHRSMTASRANVHIDAGRRSRRFYVGGVLILKTPPASRCASRSARFPLHSVAAQVEIESKN